jgi:AraC-like DNA-binding protein
MSKTRHTVSSTGNDRSTWIRTFPVTFLHDATHTWTHPEWHHLAYALSGHLQVTTPQMQLFVPPDRAMWIPAGVVHTVAMRGRVSVRSVFVAKRLVTVAAPRTIVMSSLLREVVLYANTLGALDCRVRREWHLAWVLLDALERAEPTVSELPLPRDPRAKRFAESLLAAPGSHEIETFARQCGASLRTLERLFLKETGLPLGQWRRRARLFVAAKQLDLGATVTEVALEAGYQSLSAFSFAFTRQFGCSPSRRRGGSGARPTHFSLPP